MATPGGRDRAALRAGMPSRENPLTPVPATELMTGAPSCRAGATKAAQSAALTATTATMADAAATMSAVRRRLDEAVAETSLADARKSLESIAGPVTAAPHNPNSWR